MNIPLVLAPVIVACEEQWPNYQSDCSGFVKAVAASLGVTLIGQANDIVDQIQRVPWTTVKGGPAAKAKAEAGFFVIGGVKDQPNGHVVVITPGPLAHGKYPTGYWGQLNGTGKKKTTINYSWDEDDRDCVIYSCKAIR